MHPMGPGSNEVGFSTTSLENVHLRTGRRMWRSAVGSGKELEMRRHSMRGFMGLAEKVLGHVWGVSWIVNFDGGATDMALG